MSRAAFAPAGPRTYGPRRSAAAARARSRVTDHTRLSLDFHLGCRLPTPARHACAARRSRLLHATVARSRRAAGGMPVDLRGHSTRGVESYARERARAHRALGEPRGRGWLAGGVVRLAAARLARCVNCSRVLSSTLTGWRGHAWDRGRTWSLIEPRLQYYYPDGLESTSAHLATDGVR